MASEAKPQQLVDYSAMLPSSIYDVFKESYKEFTDVQTRAGQEFLTHHDVVVESPTGSGKTLAYLLPTFTILSKRGAFGKHEFGAVILSPSRELSSQIATVAAPYAEKLGYSIALTVGGTKIEQNLKKLKNQGGNILVATPGRLFQLLSLDKDGSLKRSLRTVEVLIVDEADRFQETQFEMHIKYELRHHHEAWVDANLKRIHWTWSIVNSKAHNAIFLSAFKLATSATPEFLEKCFANIAGRKYICACHYISAAQYILAEVFAGGGKLSVTADDMIYIDNGAIPAQVLADLNDAMTFTDGFTVSSADVTRYLNTYIKKYYVHGTWSFPNPDEGKSEDIEDKVEEAPSSSEHHTESMECQPPEDTPIAEPRNSEFLAEELLGTSVKAEDSGSSEEAVNGFCSSSEAQSGSDGKVLFQLEETDPALLDRFFVVKGRKLLELFHLNGCGCEYNTESGTICLKKHPSGDVPIIEFITQGHESEVGQWLGL